MLVPDGIFQRLIHAQVIQQLDYQMQLNTLVEQHFNDVSSAGDKNKLLTACNNFREYMQNIPLPPPNVRIDQALKDIAREVIYLNGLRFLANVSVMDSLRELIPTLAPLCNHPVDVNHVVDTICCSMSRTVSGYDSYDVCSHLFHPPNTMLIQRMDHNEVIADVFVSNGELLAQVQCANNYCLCELRERNTTAAAATISKREGMEPWLWIDTMVTDQRSFSTAVEDGNHRRWLQVQAYDPQLLSDGTVSEFVIEGSARELDIHASADDEDGLASPLMRNDSNLSEWFKGFW